MTGKTGMHRTTLVKKKNLDQFCRTLLKKTLFLMSFKFFVNLVSRNSPDLMAEGAERLSGENSEDPTGLADGHHFEIGSTKMFLEEGRNF